MRLVPIEARTRDQFVIMNAIRSNVLPPVAKNARTSVQQVATIGGGGSQNAEIQFLINGPDLRTLDVLSAQLLDKMKTLPGVVDPDRSLNAGKPELSVQVDRPKASDLGVQVGDAAEALRWLVGGDQVTTYNEGSEQYEVHLRAEAINRSTEQAIGGLTVPSSRLGSIPLENVASFSKGSSPSDISRLSRQRQVTLYANMVPNASQSAIQDAIQAEWEKMAPGGDYKGRSADARRSWAARHRTSCWRSHCRSSSCI